MPIITMGRFGLCYGPFWLYDGPFWTMQWAVLDNFLEIKIFGVVLAMGRFGIDPNEGTIPYAKETMICLSILIV